MSADGPGRRKDLTGQPVRVVEGRLRSCVTVTESWVRHVACLHNSPGVDGAGISIENDIDLTSNSMNNREIAMRVSSALKSGDVFFTDLNGFQVLFVCTSLLTRSQLCLHSPHCR